MECVYVCPRTQYSEPHPSLPPWYALIFNCRLRGSTCYSLPCPTPDFIKVNSRYGPKRKPTWSQRDPIDPRRRGPGPLLATWVRRVEFQLVFRSQSLPHPHPKTPFAFTGASQMCEKGRPVGPEAAPKLSIYSSPGPGRTYQKCCVSVALGGVGEFCETGVLGKVANTTENTTGMLPIECALGLFLVVWAAF